MRKDIISRIAVIGVALGIALAGTGCGESSSVSGKDETGQEQTGQDETGQEQTGKEQTGQEQTGQEQTGQSAGADKSLREFCEDEELNDWFDSIEENVPVKLTYIIYGEAPISMEFTAPELILKTAKALETVEIDGLSEENPDYVSDAGGSGYYFDMEDGTSRSFTFVLGCFRWKDSEWHDVATYGELRDVGEELAKIGNPEHVYVYAEDRGFYTKTLETYETAWQPEDGVAGGMFIYIGEVGAAPYVEICRCNSEADPETFLTGELDERMRSEIEISGASLLDVSDVNTYTANKKELPCVLYTAEVPKEQGEGRICYLNLVMQEEDDDAAGGTRLIRFCAVYRESDQEEESEERADTLRALEEAVEEFYYKY